MSEMETLDWHNLYSESWKGEIVPDAFVHPAKYSRALIRRIYDYLFEIGALKAGDAVIDPFGGVALGAEDALRLGLDWTGCELEQKFVDLGTANIALWNARYRGKLPHWGTARLLQGDSRKLAELVGATRQATVSSPPYSESYARRADDKRPRDEREQRAGHKLGGGQIDHPRDYGETAGQLGSMHEGDLSAAIASPPYEGARVGQESGQEHCGHQDAYGASSGQLGAMPAGDVDAAISSPPYEGMDRNKSHKDVPIEHKAELLAAAGIDPDKWLGKARCTEMRTDGYGASEGQLGETQGETFWSASRSIVEQVYQVLVPGGVAAWVVKDFVRNKERVPFCDQWQQLCEACGFETYVIARAWLVEDHGTQLAHDGNHKRMKKERKSFFRRLAEKKGAPRIDYECVIFMRKPFKAVSVQPEILSWLLHCPASDTNFKSNFQQANIPTLKASGRRTRASSSG